MSDEEDQLEDEMPEDQGAEDGESDGEDSDGEAGEGEGGSKKIIIILVAAILLLGGGGAAAYFTGVLDGLLGGGGGEEVLLDDHGEPVLDEHGEPVMVKKEKEKHAKKGGDDGHGGGHGEGGASGNFLEIPAMIVNLNNDDGTPRYLRLSVQLELESSSDAAAVEAVMPRVVDQFQTYLRELRVKDLRGSAGIYRLQMELLWRVNQAAAPTKVKDVLFQEILIQ